MVGPSTFNSVYCLVPKVHLNLFKKKKKKKKKRNSVYSFIFNIGRLDERDKRGLSVQA
jgi:hypothetical protein